MSSLTETDLAFRQTVRDFARAEIGPSIFKAEWDGKFSSEVTSKLNSLGLLGILVPVEFDGAGAELRKTKDLRAETQNENAIARVSATNCAISNASSLVRISRGHNPKVDRYIRDAAYLQNWIECEDSLRDLIAKNASVR